MSKDEVYSEEVMEKIREERRETLDDILRSDDYQVVYNSEDGFSIEPV